LTRGSEQMLKPCGEGPWAMGPSKKTIAQRIAFTCPQ
jgi:hypothetical protein